MTLEQWLLPLGNAGALGVFFWVTLKSVLSQNARMMKVNERFADLIGNHMAHIEKHMAEDTELHRSQIKTLERLCEVLGNTETHRQVHAQLRADK